MHFRLAVRPFTRHEFPFPLDRSDSRIGPTHFRRTRRLRNVQQIDFPLGCTHFPMAMTPSHLRGATCPPPRNRFPIA